MRNIPNLCIPCRVWMSIDSVGFCVSVDADHPDRRGRGCNVVCAPGHSAISARSGGRNENASEAMSMLIAAVARTACVPAAAAAAAGTSPVSALASASTAVSAIVRHFAGHADFILAALRVGVQCSAGQFAGDHGASWAAWPLRVAGCPRLGSRFYDGFLYPPARPVRQLLTWPATAVTVRWRACLALRRPLAGSGVAFRG